MCTQQFLCNRSHPHNRLGYLKYSLDNSGKRFNFTSNLQHVMRFQTSQNISLISVSISLSTEGMLNTCTVPSLRPTIKSSFPELHKSYVSIVVTAELFSDEWTKISSLTVEWEEIKLNFCLSELLLMKVTRETGFQQQLFKKFKFKKWTKI